GRGKHPSRRGGDRGRGAPPDTPEDSRCADGDCAAAPDARRRYPDRADRTGLWRRTAEPQRTGHAGHRHLSCRHAQRTRHLLPGRTGGVPRRLAHPAWRPESDRAGPARHRHPARAARPQFRGSLCGDRLGRRRDPGEGRAEPRFGGDRAPRKPGGRAPEGRGRGTRPPPALRRDGQDDRRAGTLSRRDREPAGRRAAGRSRPVKAPAFWWRQEQSPAAMLLSPLAAAFGAAAARRMGRPAHYRAPVPVICVGNLVVGGAGKTPAALALAALARSEGLRPGFVATGYGGSASAPTLVERDAPAELVGDEALMLAAAAP